MRTIPKNSEAALRARGLRLTGPRRVVLEVLRGTESHPTAEWVHRAIAYQLPCHLKAQNMGTKSADLLRLTGATVETIERCSAVDGTWGMKKEYFELSMKLAAPLFKDVREAGATRVATDCPLAALQIKQGMGVEARHPIRVLAEAYGLEEEPSP
jgi:Fe-S oxidoreductase